MEQSWSVWIDENKKVISTKEISKGKQVWFEGEEIGIEQINKLVSKGYKIC